MVILKVKGCEASVNKPRVMLWGEHVLFNIMEQAFEPRALSDFVKDLCP